MIRAIIVDNEYVVRKGFVRFIPWEQYDVEIVGEAPTGEAALELLERMSVDLVVTDLTMPGMDGFDLIRQIQKRYTNIWIIVRTCHQSFHHIQEAVRLGVIDYIVKSEIDNDKLLTTIQRNVERIRKEKKRRNEEPRTLFMTPIQNDEDWQFPYSFVTENKAEQVTLIPGIGAYIRNADLLERFQSSEAICSVFEPNRWISVIIHGAWNATESCAASLFTKYRDEKLFYDYKNDRSYYEVDWKTIDTLAVEEERKFHSLRQQFNSYRWIFSDELFERMVHEVGVQRPFAPKWVTYLRDTLKWLQHMEAIPEASTYWEASGRLLYWEQWIEWLRSIRLILRHNDCSEEVCIVILRAMNIVSQELGIGINQTEVAKRVGLSRSYLNRCFTPYVGKSFQKFLNDIRIEKATILLTSTQDPVYTIAERTGFRDVKYFSKLYKQKTGKFPKDSRKNLSSYMLQE